MKLRHNLMIKQLLTILAVLVSVVGYSQVYNYSIPSLQNIETNPAILSTKKFDNRVKLTHENRFSSTNPFNYTSFRYSKYLESKFVGFGVTLNKTSLGQGVGYNHVGFGVGYRNVLFNKLYLRLGAMYKVNQIKAPPGEFNYFQFTSMEVSSATDITHNLNWSVILGKNNNQQFISFSHMNAKLPGLESSSFTMPQYYSVTAGNFLSFLSRKPETKITYNGIVKKIGDTTTVSHYMNIQVNANLSRKVGLKIGARVGINNGSNYHLAPMISVYSKKMAVQAYYNLFIKKKDIYTEIPQSTQFSFTYKFY
ncbi:MAG: hypothetical protein ACI9J3_003189 [Parvicellaceae bacterium]|jgi:hypothetical protein